MNAQTVELFGYAASVFVAISLLMVSLVKLRILNLIGCTFFVIYGSLLGSIPIVLTNGFIMLVNIYFLVQMYRKDISSFEYVSADKRLPELMDFYRLRQKDIARYYPDFRECHLRAASEGRGLVYAARKGARIQGFAIALGEESMNLGQYCDDSQGFKSAIQTVRDSQYSGEPLFLADYIVRKYRDLGLARIFHEKLVEDLSDSHGAFLWLNHRDNRRMKRLLLSLGYEQVEQTEDYQLLRLDIKSKGLAAPAS